MKLMILTLILSGFGMAAGTPAHEAAEDKARLSTGGASLGLKACHNDIEKFCKEILAGESRIGKCLQGQAKKLSKSCRKWAGHGGKGHEQEALLDLDRTPPPSPK